MKTLVGPLRIYTIKKLVQYMKVCMKPLTLIICPAGGAMDKSGSLTMRYER